MHPCVVVAASWDGIPPENIIKGILDVEDLPQPIHTLPEVQGYSWHIDTKYYEADVDVCVLGKKSIGTEEFAASVNALILPFDSGRKDGLKDAEGWLPFIEELDPEIKILLCHNCVDRDERDDGGLDVSKYEAQDWCLKRGFELVELDPVLIQDEEVEDDFPETTGIKRVVQALHAHIWPNLVKKTQGNKDGTNAMEAIPDDSFEELFQSLSEMKIKADALSPSERKRYAEKIAVAFWKSMGGSDSEVDGISSEDD